MCFLGLGRLRREVRHLKESVLILTERLNELENDLESEIFPNPTLQAALQDKVGQTVTVNTASATVEGTLLTVTSDSLEIRESTGDLVLIPYSRITVLH
ncbi:DUF2642 domain-containing protein [Paenibacillus sp. J22TS3]|uniref:DUF2642 domain-containing protein n=1 Tax=Paenibacillus sp. J22TS3 TaxID=2807192 RepID=UPI001B2833C7|nr:DUF2642 domain-containing protein [Paenibacillus sp. J22TS3]GIP21177.1 hypothetical protein J22TS3_14520 [Paenibacillus sp. J22TS3]